MILRAVGVAIIKLFCICMWSEVYSSNKLKINVSVDLQRGCKMRSAEAISANIYDYDKEDNLHSLDGPFSF